MARDPISLLSRGIKASHGMCLYIVNHLASSYVNSSALVVAGCREVCSRLQKQQILNFAFFLRVPATHSGYFGTLNFSCFTFFTALGRRLQDSIGESEFCFNTSPLYFSDSMKLRSMALLISLILTTTSHSIVLFLNYTF